MSLAWHTLRSDCALLHNGCEPHARQGQSPHYLMEISVLPGLLQGLCAAVLQGDSAVTPLTLGWAALYDLVHAMYGLHHWH